MPVRTWDFFKTRESHAESVRLGNYEDDVTRNLYPRNLDSWKLDPGNLDPRNLDPGNLDPRNLDPGNLDPINLDHQKYKLEKFRSEKYRSRKFNPGNLDPENRIVLVMNIHCTGGISIKWKHWDPCTIFYFEIFQNLYNSSKSWNFSQVV